MRSVAFGFVTSLQLPPDHAAAARARRFVADTLRGWGCDDAIPDAELLVSELVTNAVLHARSATRVTVERDGTTVRVSVCDDSPDAAPPARTRARGGHRRGLLLVDRIARRWGVDPSADGKCVWFEIDGRTRGVDASRLLAVELEHFGQAGDLDHAARRAASAPRSSNRRPCAVEALLRLHQQAQAGGVDELAAR